MLNRQNLSREYAEQPGAYWLLLTPEGCEFHRTSYDLEASSSQSQRLPQAQEFAEENMLTVSPAAEVMKIFERRT